MPERDVGEHVEREQEAELDLDREDRRQLEEPGARDRLAEEREARGGEGAGVGDRRRGAADVGVVELERRGELDDRRARVPDRGEAVADVVVREPVPDAAGVGEDAVERRPDLVGAPSRK